MEFIYDRKKAKKLLKERNIDLEEIADLLLREGPVEVIKNKSRYGQWIFLMKYKGYIHAIPFVMDAGGGIILKTAYPLRKYNKKYGGNNETQV